MPQRLGPLALRLDTIANRLHTLGLVRAAEDLRQIAVELRRLLGEHAVGEPPDASLSAEAPARAP